MPDYTSILINYAAHRDADRVLAAMVLIDNDLNNNILKGFLIKWDKALSDDGGATEEQDKNLDSIIESTIEELLGAQTNVNF